uniref:Tetratricopeptide SHNi-TPR domain-containing protein n=1 Tax=Setaria digitata TaxID=48799 RepID=A0A915PGY9_9BILA
MAPISRNDEFGSEERKEGDVIKFRTLLAEGKQAYVSGRFKEAEIKLSEAAELSVNIYGYFAIPTFDPHLYYGRTLLELARMEDGVFSNALQGVTTADDKTIEKQNSEKDENVEQMESLTEKVGIALEENVEALNEKVPYCRIDSFNILEESQKGKEKKTDLDAGEYKTIEAVESAKNGEEEIENDSTDHEEDQSKTERKEEEDKSVEEKKQGKIDVEKEGEEDGKSDEDSKDGISEEDDARNESNDAGDVEYLQLAWENLEVARTICDKHLEEEGWKEKKVEVLLDLANCSTDAENYKQAIDDIDTCIVLTESIFDADDRPKLEAELHGSQEKLEKTKEEIDELKSLLPEIQIKIDDSLESARSLIKESISVEDDEENSLKSSVKEMPVDDVSNLVRKKSKRPAENAQGEEPKRIKSVDGLESAEVDSCVKPQI